MTAPENIFLADTIARDHSEGLRRFVASRLRKAKDAIDDVIQEVYLRIIRRGEKETVRNPEAYVIQVAAHTLHDMGYGKSYDGIGSMGIPGVDPEESTAGDPVAAADFQRRIEQLDRVLKELPPRAYASFLLYRVHGLSHQKIAELHQVHPNTIKNDIKLAASHLSQRFGRDAE